MVLPKVKNFLICGKFFHPVIVSNWLEQYVTAKFQRGQDTPMTRLWWTFFGTATAVAE